MVSDRSFPSLDLGQYADGGVKLTEVIPVYSKAVSPMVVTEEGNETLVRSLQNANALY